MTIMKNPYKKTPNSQLLHKILLLKKKKKRHVIMVKTYYHKFVYAYVIYLHIWAMIGPLVPKKKKRKSE